MIPHALDFALALVAQGITHVIAQDDAGHTVVADLDPNSDNPEASFPVHVKGPRGTGLEAVLVNAIVWHVNNAAGFEALRGITFSGSETISGDVAVPTAWWLTAAFAAVGSQSYYDAVILPRWNARAPQVGPPVVVTAPTPVLPPPPAVSPVGPPDFLTQMLAQLAKLNALAEQLAELKKAVDAIKASPKPNEGLPPKNPKKRRGAAK